MMPLTPGTRLTREWQSVRHEVVVEPDGRLGHQDELHRSLDQLLKMRIPTSWAE